MARGRMIKPELWTSKRINRVSLESNLLFIALLNFCDDFGTIQDSNRMILGNCFPYRENITEKMIEKWKSELIEVQLLAKIEHHGRNLLAVVKWEKHQTIMNRSKRNNIDNNLENQDVIHIIESLISVSLGSNYPIDNRQETNDKGKETSYKDQKVDDFEQVWTLYEKKGNRKTSLAKWIKLSNDQKALALQKIPAYVKSTPDKQYRKNFETWIYQECWNDEIPVKQTGLFGNNCAEQKSELAEAIARRQREDEEKAKTQIDDPDLPF